MASEPSQLPVTDSTQDVDDLASHPDSVGLIDCIDLPVVVIGHGKTISSFNAAAGTVLSVVPAMVGQPLSVIPLLKNAQNLEAFCDHVLGGGKPSQLNMRDEAGSWFSVRIAPVSSEREINGAVLAFTNVTAFRASLEQAVQEREYAKAILNAVIDPLVVVDGELRVQSANEAFYRVFGVSRDSAHELPLYEVGLRDWDIAALKAFFDPSTAMGERKEDLEADHQLPEIGRRTLLLKACGLTQRHEARPLTVVTIQDITERRAAEEALRQSIAMKDEFLSLVSHELRTPISTIMGNGRILMRLGDRLAEDDKRQAFADIVSEGERLQRIIENLLILTRIESGVHLEVEPIDLPELVDPLLGQVRSRNPERMISIHIEDGLPLAVGQPTLVTLMLENLLRNAEKYSDPDSPVELRLLHNKDNGQVEAHVLDHGIGCDESDHERIFTPFYRSPAAKFKAAGMGLGLAVCKKAVEAQGGMISVRSRLEGGSDFSFSLPTAAISDVLGG